MFKLFEKGKIATKMANLFYGIDTGIDQLKLNAQSENEVIYVIYTFVYSLTRGVFDRMDSHNLPVTYKLYIPKMGWITIAEANARIMLKLSPYIADYNLETDVEEIMDKGTLYYKIENSLPPEKWSHLD
jgi:hypothetical protein